MAFQLAIAEGPGRGEAFRFRRPASVGRGPDNDVVLEDAGVSRRHARIERQRREWVVRDRDSSNGTEVNGVRVDGACVLHPGDRIRIGPVVFDFQECGAPRSRALLGAASVLLALLAWRAAHRSVRAVEPACPDVAVDESTATRSFGHGGVDVECGGGATFGFQASQGRSFILRFRSSDVATGELELRLNGRHFGWVAGPGEQRMTLPDALLAAEGANRVSFVRAGTAPWAISEVRIEAAGAPPGDLRAARDAFQRGKRKLDERRVAPRNLWDAWRAISDARREMEGISPRPALDADAGRLLAAIERDLRRECGRLLFAAARAERYGDEEGARRAYREVLQHFPGEDATGCRNEAEARLASLPAGGLDDP